jgi:hypothetical protein
MSTFTRFNGAASALLLSAFLAVAAAQTGVCCTAPNGGGPVVYCIADRTNGYSCGGGWSSMNGCIVRAVV